MEVTVYSTPTCPWCTRAKEYLQRKGVPYVEKDVSQDYAAALEMVQKSGQQGVPVITVDGQAVVGFDQRRLDHLLSNATSGKPTFGAAIADASRITMKNGGVPIFGAYVGRVNPGSPAARAGLQAGDIITDINLSKITNADAFEKALSRLEPGARAVIVWSRGDKEFRRDISL
jgi:glutaredoxin 3